MKVFHRSIPQIVSSIWKHSILLIATVIALFPTAFMLLTAFKSQEDYVGNKIGLPQVFTLENFISAIVESPFLRWVLNSTILVSGSVVLCTVVSCLAAFAIARMDFVGRNGLLAVSTSLMMVPPVVMIVPLFVLYSQIGLINTFYGTILIYAGIITPFSIYLLTTFFRTLPNEIFESARLEGAGQMTLLLKIAIPLSLPALLSLVVVNSLFVWNDLLISIIFLPDDERRTLMAGLSVFQGRYNNQIPLTMAGMAIASAPMLILYLMFQRYFIRGMMAGAIK